MKRPLREPTFPELHWDLYSVPWTEEELTVVWAAAPKKDQNYNQAHPIVREVADLIGRSPSAVDRKIANLWAVWRPGRGLAHFSKLDERIVERYRHDLTRLEHDASNIRAELVSRRPTARAEALGPDDEGERIELLWRLREAARDEAGNEIGVHVFERKGTWYIGFFIEAYRVLTNPSVIPSYGVAAIAIYRQFEPAVARLIERTRDSERFAVEVTKRILPDLDQSHFSKRELEQIAKQLTYYQVDPFRFNRRLARAFEKVPVAESRQRVEGVFHIRCPQECMRCTIILAAAALRALQNSAA